MRHLILLLPLLLSCADHRGAPGPQASQRPLRYSINWGFDVPKEDRPNLERHLICVRRAWEKDHGQAPFTHYTITSTIPQHYQGALGKFLGRSGGSIWIYLWVGDDHWGTLPALYHEHCHDLFPDLDGKHEDPRWVQWDQKTLALGKECH